MSVIGCPFAVFNPTERSIWGQARAWEQTWQADWPPEHGWLIQPGGFIVYAAADCQIVLRRDSNVRWAVVHWHDGVLVSVGSLKTWWTVARYLRVKGRGYQSGRDREADREAFA